MFAQRLAGHSVARIACALNEAGVPCPSVADPARNPHRTAAELADPRNVTLGHKRVQRWNQPDGWVISNRPAHPPLISEADFITAQDVSATRGPGRPSFPVCQTAGLCALLMSTG
jgi:hypothetical protein